MTIEGNLVVNGDITSTNSNSVLSVASVVSALATASNTTSENKVKIGIQGDDAADPDAFLTIAGDSTVQSLWAKGAIVTEQYVAAASDIIFKENIHTINSALEKTNRMRGVYFNKKGSSNREVGVIAQEVEKVFPEVVNGEEGSKSVCYANLCGVLIEAVKDLSRENISQATEISSLQNKVANHQREISNIWNHKRTDDRIMSDSIAALKREFSIMKRDKR